MIKTCIYCGKIYETENTKHEPLFNEYNVYLRCIDMVVKK